MFDPKENRLAERRRRRSRVMKWPSDPDNREVIRQLNWFIEVGFIVEKIDFSNWREYVSFSGECQPDDIGAEYTNNGPFTIKFFRVRNFSVRNIDVSNEYCRFLLIRPRDFSKEKDAAQKRFYHLKTADSIDHPGFEIDFEDIEIVHWNRPASATLG